MKSLQTVWVVTASSSHWHRATDFRKLMGYMIHVVVNVAVASNDRCFSLKKIIILFTMKMFCFLLFWFSFVLLQSCMCSISRKEAMNIALSAHITVINDLHACEFVSAIGSNICLTNTQLQNPMRSF